MNKDEYVIINKSVLQKRIDDLENELIRMINKNYSETSKLQIQFTLNAYKEILSQSTPLIPVLEDAFDKGGAYTLGSYKDFKQIHPNKQEYISNLKLNI